MTQAPEAPARFVLHSPAAGGGAIDPTPEQQLVIDHAGRRLRVLAGPGTGKSATLVEAVADRIGRRGVQPEQILVLTFSRRASAELTSRITRRLALTTREPLVRTLHGYAFSLLRAQAVRSGEPTPRLLGAGESDQMVRELLAGQRESGRGGWPDAVRAALDSPAFAAELRDLMLRTAERGITPGRLSDLGRRRHRPEWQAAARFAREYQDVSDLRQGTTGLGAALDQAELTRAALGLLSDDDVLAAEQSRIRRIFVDEYQDVDPAQARLIGLLASGADELVVFGDPDQSIYAFRGSDPGALRDIEVDSTVSLTASRRLAPAVLLATRRVAGELPGSSPHRKLTSVTPGSIPSDDSAAQPAGAIESALPAAGEVVVRTLPTAAREAAFIADELRRAHLRAGVPWSEMAVLVRSPVASLPALRRAFAAAGVPMTLSGQDTVLTADPVVAMLLEVLRCGQQPELLTGQLAVELLGMPAVGVDAEALRRLRRHLRAAHPGEGSTPDLLAAVLAGAPLPDGLPDDLTAPVRRIRSMLDVARAGAKDPAAEQSLWQVWQYSGLEAPLVAASLRGGRPGQRADTTLDSVLGLFGMAAELADRMPLAGVSAFLDVVDGQRIPGDPTAGPSRSADAVAVLSAHAAKGLEWDVVCLAGVAEGRWPVLRARQSLLGTEEVLDAAAGLPVTLVDSSAAVQEERRLFYVAATRARFRLIATSVADQDTVPSRFLNELAGSESDLATGWPSDIDGSERRSLHLTDLVAELRRVVTDPAVPERTLQLAAAQLARLAAAGVIGAHPRDWYGLDERSTDRPPVPDGHPVTISPSTVESLAACALRGVLERRGARGGSSQQQIEGIVVHAMVDGLAKGVARVDLLAEMEGFLAQQSQLPPWLVARTRRALASMLTAAETWIAELPANRTLAGSEVRLRVAVPPPGPVSSEPDPNAVRRNVESSALPQPDGVDADSVSSDRRVETRGQATDLKPALANRPVRLEGRADRLDRGSDGSLIIVDFKTGATVPSRATVAENVQLAVYQLAVQLGGAAGLGDSLIGAGSPTSAASAPAGPARSGGAELVFLRSGLNVRRQPPLEPDAHQHWAKVVREAAEQLASSASTARENKYCERCPVRSSCPLQPEGRQVTR
jgi:superfamily I DNA/RNA helicase